MFNKIIATLLVVLFSAKSFGIVLHIDDHHSSEDDVHGYFHSIGQPHSHDDYGDSENAQASFVISYSNEAVEHSNEFQERASFFIFEVAQTPPLSVTPEGVHHTRLIDWDAPFIEYSPPPPKV